MLNLYKFIYSFTHEIKLAPVGRALGSAWKSTELNILLWLLLKMILIVYGWNAPFTNRLVFQTLIPSFKIVRLYWPRATFTFRQSSILSKALIKKCLWYHAIALIWASWWIDRVRDYLAKNNKVFGYVLKVLLSAWYLVSTVLTLLVIPLLYYALLRRKGLQFENSARAD